MSKIKTKPNSQIIGVQKEKNKYNKFLIIVFILIQIQFLYESAPGMLRWSKEIITFVWPGFILIMFILFSLFKSLKIETNKLIFILYILSTLMITFILNQDFYTENLFFASAVICGFLISNIFNKNDYLDGYVSVMVIYSIYSLIATYIILPLHINGMFNFFRIYTSILGTPFVDMWLSFAVSWNGLMRNQGIFREPGVFQFFILVALVCEMFYLKSKTKIKRLRFIILLVTLISTFSTSGLVSVIPLIAAFFLQNKKTSSKKDILLITVVFIIMYILIKSNNDATIRLTNSFNKLSGDNDNLSKSVRFESIFNILKMSVHNPIFGSSFVNGFIYIQSNYNTFESNDITGTMFSYIMALGYPAGLLINFYFYRFCSLLNKNILISILIFISLFLSLNSQNLVYSSVLWCFIFFGVNEKQ